MKLLHCIVASLLVTSASQAQDLTARIDEAIGRAPLNRAIWAIQVEDRAGGILYAHNGGTLVVPASVRKLFTAATVSHCLGLSSHRHTELWRSGDDLVLRGGGDPSLGGRYAFDRDAVFAPFIVALQSRGIRMIPGDIVADVSGFDRETIFDGWKSGTVESDDGVPVDALTWNENVVGVLLEGADCAQAVASTDPSFVSSSAAIVCGHGVNPRYRLDGENHLQVDGFMEAKSLPYGPELVPVHDAGLYAATALRQALTHSGITVKGRVRVGSSSGASAERLAVIDSPSVADLLTLVLTNSQNHYAEVLFKDLSWGSRPASYADSRAVEREFLRDEVGLEEGTARFADGSGLSTDNLVTPAAIVRVLHWMDAPERRWIFWQMLAAPGSEGTLHRRLLPLASRLRGKTGSLNGVNSLAFIVRNADGNDRYAAIVLNHHLASGSEALKAIDDIARAIAGM